MQSITSLVIELDLMLAKACFTRATQSMTLSIRTAVK